MTLGNHLPFMTAFTTSEFYGSAEWSNDTGSLSALAYWTVIGSIIRRSFGTATH